MPTEQQHSLFSVNENIYSDPVTFLLFFFISIIHFWIFCYEIIQFCEKFSISHFPLFPDDFNVSQNVFSASLD